MQSYEKLFVKWYWGMDKLIGCEEPARAEGANIRLVGKYMRIMAEQEKMKISWQYSLANVGFTDCRQIEPTWLYICRP
uniref:Uncharacterized protein n=1 Tax=uncultured Prevotella sp. TaxID=159272 RepID=A0A6G8F1Y6_9BACT|nr:hypothetical protein Prevot485_2770 [uncultured Prevotella sp.]